jgi:predicted TPR repeat methyltransferase
MTAEERFLPFNKIKIPIILFWLLETLVVPFAPTVQRLVNWAKYTYYKTPRIEIIKLFDNYAEIFEEHLVNVLEYDTPSTLTEFIKANTTLSNPINRVLELGCGTGLFGQALTKQFCIERLIGIDLSWKMLKKSKAKAVYKELHNADLLAYLRNSSYQYDLIVACDVFIYIGELKAVMLEVHKHLQPGGHCAFSVERQDFGNFTITRAGRFQHSLNYLQRLSAEIGFKNFKSDTVYLRKEHQDKVPGYLILMQK